MLRAKWDELDYGVTKWQSIVMELYAIDYKQKILFGTFASRPSDTQKVVNRVASRNGLILRMIGAALFGSLHVPAGLRDPSIPILGPFVPLPRGDHAG